MPNSAVGWSDGENEVSPDLLAVRSTLRSLPKLECRPGFEFRMQRRLEAELAGAKPAGSARGWSLGWAGAGLGFATALAIAFFAFDMHVKTPSLAGVSSGGQAVPVTTPTKVISDPVQEQQAAVPKGLSNDKQLAATKKDTTKPPTKADLPEDLYHVVGTSPSPAPNR